jgi:hypothetical protein
LHRLLESRVACQFVTRRKDIEKLIHRDQGNPTVAIHRLPGSIKLSTKDAASVQRVFQPRTYSGFRLRPKTGLVDVATRLIRWVVTSARDKNMQSNRPAKFFTINT